MRDSAPMSLGVIFEKKNVLRLIVGDVTAFLVDTEGSQHINVQKKVYNETLKEIAPSKWP